VIACKVLKRSFSREFLSQTPVGYLLVIGLSSGEVLGADMRREINENQPRPKISLKNSSLVASNPRFHGLESDFHLTSSSEYQRVVEANQLTIFN